MPIDPADVKWDTPAIDPGKVQWDGEAKKPTIAPYSFDNPLIPSLMTMMQGPTFGWGDEIAGKLGADPARYRATIEAHQKEFPVSSALGQIGAGALVPFGGAALAKFNPMATASAVGGVASAAQLAGDAPPGKTAEEAVKGGAMGMALGPAMMLGMKPVGSIADAVLGQVSSKAPVVGENLAEHLARRRVVEALQRDSVNPADIQAQMKKLGPEARLADVGDAATLGALDLNAIMPGTTGKALNQAKESRVFTRPDRLRQVSDEVSGGYGRANDVLDSLITQKKTAADPLYARVHRIRLRPSNALSDQISAAIKLGAGKRAEEVATALRTPFTLQEGAQTHLMRDLDFLKQGLDDLIAKHTDTAGKMDSLARAANSLRTDMLKQLDFITMGKYKAARDAFAGPAALEDAVNQGMRFIHQDGVKLERSMASMSASEQEAFRVGAAEALRNLVGTQGGATTLLGSTTHNANLREKLQILLGKDQQRIDKVMGVIKAEATMKRLDRQGTGSPTEQRRMFGEDQGDKVMSDAANLVGTAATTGFFPVMKGLLSGNAVKSSAFGTPEPVRNAIGNMLLGRPTAEEIKALERVQQMMMMKESGAGGLLGAGSGAASGWISN